VAPPRGPPGGGRLPGGAGAVEGADVDVRVGGQDFRQFFYVNTRPAVDVRRVFSG